MRYQIGMLSVLGFPKRIKIMQCSHCVLIYSLLLYFVLSTNVILCHNRNARSGRHEDEIASRQIPLIKDLNYLVINNKNGLTRSMPPFAGNNRPQSLLPMPHNRNHHVPNRPAQFNNNNGQVSRAHSFVTPHPGRFPTNFPKENNQVDAEFHDGTDNKDEIEQWPLAMVETPKIMHLDVKCEKNAMKVSIEFDKPFNGVIFSKGHYNYRNCIYLPPSTGRKNIFFDISINSCGTTGNAQGTFYNEDVSSDSGLFFENTLVIQYDPQVQEAWDQARKLRCTWHDQYEKSVSFRPFPVDMLDVVRADFAGDNVGCWMQIQVGKGPWASEVAGIVKIGQTMTMVLAIKDEENKFDMLVRNCVANDGKRAPIELVDTNGCIMRPKLMTKFTKIKNFGSSASVLSYTHFQAFKFPDSMEVHFQCTIQICRHQCPEQCSLQPGADVINLYNNGDINAAGIRKRRDVSELVVAGTLGKDNSQESQIGLNKIIQVVSSRDLSFPINSNETQMPLVSVEESFDSNQICIPAYGLVSTLFVFVCIFCILISLTFTKKVSTKEKTDYFFTNKFQSLYMTRLD